MNAISFGIAADCCCISSFSLSGERFWRFWIVYSFCMNCMDALCMCLHVYIHFYAEFSCCEYSHWGSLMADNQWNGCKTQQRVTTEWAKTVTCCWWLLNLDRFINNIACHGALWLHVVYKQAAHPTRHIPTKPI